MAHQQMFDDDDPFLARVRGLALALPDADEKVSHGRPAFFTKKVFCIYGGALKIDNEWVQHPQAVLVQVTEDERHALVQDARVFVPAYWGPSGWIGLDLDDATDWDEVAELLEESFRLTAPKRAITALDQN